MAAQTRSTQKSDRPSENPQSAATELLANLRAQGFSVSVDGDRLRPVVPKGKLPNTLRAAINTHRAALVGLLKSEAERPIEDPEEGVKPGEVLKVHKPVEKTAVEAQPEKPKLARVPRKKTPAEGVERADKYWRDQEKRLEGAMNPIPGKTFRGWPTHSKDVESRKPVESEVFWGLYMIVRETLKGEFKKKLPSSYYGALAWLAEEQWRVDMAELIMALGHTPGPPDSHAFDSLKHFEKWGLRKPSKREAGNDSVFPPPDMPYTDCTHVSYGGEPDKDSELFPSTPDWFPLAVQSYRWVLEWLKWRKDKRLKTTFDFRLCKSCSHIVAEAVKTGRKFCHVCGGERWIRQRYTKRVIKQIVNQHVMCLGALPAREQDRKLRGWRKEILSQWQQARDREHRPDWPERPPYFDVLDEVESLLMFDRLKGLSEARQQERLQAMRSGGRQAVADAVEALLAERNQAEWEKAAHKEARRGL